MQQRHDALVAGKVAGEDHRASGVLPDVGVCSLRELRGAHATTDNGNAARAHGLHVHEPVANAIRDCNSVRCAPWQVAVEEATYQALNASARVCSVRWQLGRQQRVRVIHDRYARELRPGNEETLAVRRMEYGE